MRACTTFLAVIAVLAIGIGNLALRYVSDYMYSDWPSAPELKPISVHCYQLAFSPGFTGSPRRVLPSSLRLTPVDAQIPVQPTRRWYRASIAPLSVVHGDALWRPAGPDSIDVVFHYEWYTGIFMRLPIHGATAGEKAQRTGRARWATDTDWLGPLGVVTVTPTSC